MRTFLTSFIIALASATALAEDLPNPEYTGKMRDFLAANKKPAYMKFSLANYNIRDSKDFSAQNTANIAFKSSAGSVVEVADIELSKDNDGAYIKIKVQDSYYWVYIPESLNKDFDFCSTKDCFGPKLSKVVDAVSEGIDKQLTVLNGCDPNTIVGPMPVATVELKNKTTDVLPLPTEKAEPTPAEGVKEEIKKIDEPKQQVGAEPKSVAAADAETKIKYLNKFAENYVASSKKLLTKIQELQNAAESCKYITRAILIAKLENVKPDINEKLDYIKNVNTGSKADQSTQACRIIGVGQKKPLPISQKMAIAKKIINDKKEDIMGYVDCKLAGNVEKDIYKPAMRYLDSMVQNSKNMEDILRDLKRCK